MKKLMSMLLALTFLFAFACAEEKPAETLYGFVLSVEDDNALLIATESLGQFAEIDETSDQNVATSTVTQVLVRLPDTIKATDFYGTWVRVDYNGVMTMSLPGQINADAVTACFAEYGEIEEIGDGVIALAIHFGEDLLHVNLDETTVMPQNLKVGDTVRVFYNGQMTRSIPAQIFALAIERAAQVTVISVAGNASTGYAWTANVEDRNVAALLSVEYIVDDYEGDVMPAGIGGTYFFTFSAVGVGETLVNFSYARSWEDEAIETEQHRLIVGEDLSIACELVSGSKTLD